MKGGNPLDVCPIDVLSRDLLLVDQEQQMLQSITNSYFPANPSVNRAEVMKDINDAMNFNGFGGILNYVFGDGLQRRIIKREFTDKGIPFDIGNIDHRIKLGRETVRERQKEYE